MVRLAELPDEATILGFRGTLDFALWRGLPYARSWPKKAQPGPGTGSWTTATQLGDLSRRIQNIDPRIIAAAQLQPLGSNQTWRDLIIASLYGTATHT